MQVDEKRTYMGHNNQREIGYQLVVWFKKMQQRESSSPSTINVALSPLLVFSLQYLIS